LVALGLSRTSTPEPGTWNLIYDMFHFGRLHTPGDWIVHLIGALIALFLIWWMLHAFLGI